MKLVLSALVLFGAVSAQASTDVCGKFIECGVYASLDSRDPAHPVDRLFTFTADGDLQATMTSTRSDNADYKNARTLKFTNNGDVQVIQNDVIVAVGHCDEATKTCLMAGTTIFKGELFSETAVLTFTSNSVSLAKTNVNAKNNSSTLGPVTFQKR